MEGHKVEFAQVVRVWYTHTIVCAVILDLIRVVG